MKKFESFKQAFTEKRDLVWIHTIICILMGFSSCTGNVLLKCFVLIISERVSCLHMAHK